MLYVVAAYEGAALLYEGIVNEWHLWARRTDFPDKFPVPHTSASELEEMFEKITVFGLVILGLTGSDAPNLTGVAENNHARALNWLGKIYQCL